MTAGLAFIAIILLSTFPGWHEETDENGSERDVKPFPSRPILQVSVAATMIAAILGLISALWQHIAAVATSTTAQQMAYGPVKTEVGTAAMVLGWTAFALLAFVGTGLLIMAESISILDKLTDDD